jgi:diguanylate cyclase (GGDEF)-like protein/PAS domain S-box-containing protein
MIFEINTLAFISSVIFLAEFIALLVQYVVNKTSRGIIWWLQGSFFMAIGVIFSPLVYVKPLEILARFANPLIILGHIFIYIGIIRFFGRKENKWALIFIYAVFFIFYNYFMYGFNDITSRSLDITISLTFISFMTAKQFFFNKDRHSTGSGTFIAIVFVSYGCFCLFRTFILLFSPPIKAYTDQGVMLQLSFIVPIFMSILWTNGFIILLNQWLNAENLEEKEKLQLVFNTSPDAALISRLSDGTIIDINSGFLNMTGYTREEVLGKTTIKINIWRSLTDRESFINEVKAKGICENREFFFRRKNESLLTRSISAKIIAIQAIPHIVSIVHDITESKIAEEAIRESEELYRSILNASPDDITITDLQGRIQVVSPAAKKLFGYEPQNESFLGSQLVDYIIPEDRERAKANIQIMFKGELSGPNEYSGIRKDNSTFHIEVNSGLIHDANGQPVKMVFIVRDISERKEAEEKIQQLIQQLEVEKQTAQLNAITDSLTGLPNRRYFDQALLKEIRRYKRTGNSLSLIMLDVDHFKKYNDRYGHVAGDECLRQIGSVLRQLVGRATDIVARYGGEEFVAILSSTDQEGAELLAERIRKTIEALEIPHSDSKISEFVTVSLGVVTVKPPIKFSSEQIVVLADEAMYSAKRAGRNRVSVAPLTLENHL